MGAYYCEDCEKTQCHHEVTVNICSTCKITICDNCTVHQEHEADEEAKPICNGCYIEQQKLPESEV